MKKDALYRFMCSQRLYFASIHAIFTCPYVERLNEWTVSTVANTGRSLFDSSDRGLDEEMH